MRLVIDNALSPRIALGLRAKGHDVIHVRDLGMASATDAQIFAFAQAEGRTIISADADFSMLLSMTHQQQPSFVLLRRTDKRPGALLRVLVDNLPGLEPELLTGSVVVIEDTRIRVRKLPL